MNSFQLQLLLIAAMTASACALPGVFLVLRGVALMSDAISHAVLLGIICMFLLVKQLHSYWLLVGASFAGLATVIITEWIINTHCLKKDAAIGLVYPLFFSLGVILITLCARNIHLDLDMVFLGELAFAPFNRLFINGHDCGPQALWMMSGIFIFNLILLFIFYKELTLSIFDNIYASVIGMRPRLLYYGLMGITSVTVVGAFDVVGSIVVVALMITPAATAYLLTDQLDFMLILSVIIGIFSAINGYVFAHMFDVSIAGAIACVTGIVFIGALLFSPEKGIVSHWFVSRQKQLKIARKLLHNALKQNVDLVALTHDEKALFASQTFGWQMRYAKSVVLYAYQHPSR